MEISLTQARAHHQAVLGQELVLSLDLTVDDPLGDLNSFIIIEGLILADPDLNMAVII